MNALIAGQSFAIVLWGWLKSHVRGSDLPKGKLYSIEEVGQRLDGQQS